MTINIIQRGENSHYMSNEIRIVIPLPWKRYGYVVYDDVAGWYRPHIFIAFGRIGWVRFGLHFRAGIQ